MTLQPSLGESLLALVFRAEIHQGTTKIQELSSITHTHFDPGRRRRKLPYQQFRFVYALCLTVCISMFDAGAVRKRLGHYGR